MQIQKNEKNDVKLKTEVTERQNLLEQKNKRSFELPFQNRSENLLKIAQKLMRNSFCAKRNERRNIGLISFTQCMGTGKTRITSNFLNIVLSKKYEHLLDECQKEFFEQSILFYMNWNDFAEYRVDCESFKHAFYYKIFSEIFTQLNIMYDDSKLQGVTKLLKNLRVKKFLKQLFINKEEKEILHIF